MTAAESTKLEEARRAFAEGDFAKVRELARALTRAEDAEVARQAGELRARVGIDPIAVGVLVVCFAFFALVVARYVL